MENYTVDLAQLGKKEGSARPMGFEQAFQDGRINHQASPKQQDIPDADADAEAEGGDEDEDGYRDEDDDGREDVDADDDENENEPDDFMDSYEVDLGGLGDKPSSVLVGDAIHPREEVASEDEGPEDFTQNLEAWMRGSKKSKKEQTEDIAEEHGTDLDSEQDLSESISGHGFPEESAIEPLGISTPVPLGNHATVEEGIEKEAKLQAPPLPRLSTEMLQEKAAEEVFDRISALQAEVENMRVEDEARRAAHEALLKEHEEMRNEYDSARDDDRARYNALHSKHDQLQRTHEDSKEALRSENKDLTLEYKNVLGQLRALENQAISERGTKVEMLRAKYEPAFQELEAIKVQAEHDRNAAKSQVETITRDLKASKDESSSRKAEMDMIQETNSVAVKYLETELEARRKEVALERKESVDRANEAASLVENIAQKDGEISELNGKVETIEKHLRQVQEQLGETRRIVDTVEDENDRLVQENHRQAERVAELEAIVNKGKSADTGTAPVTDDHIITDETNHKALLEELSDQHQITLSSLKANHSNEIQTLRQALIQSEESMRKHSAQLAKAHEENLTSLSDQLTTLTHQQTTTQQTSAALEKGLRSAIRTLSTKLSRADTIAKTEAHKAQQQIQDAQQTNAIVNAEMESRFVTTIEEREREWRRRIELLLREREKMGKVLMWGWGREELGSKTSGDGGQEYRYKFYKKG